MPLLLPLGPGILQPQSLQHGLGLGDALGRQAEGDATLGVLHQALGLEMDAISSAVIGGTLLTGGVGNVFGSFFGVLINGTISSLVKTNGKLSSSWPNVVTALLLCFFIVLQAIFAKVKARRS